MVAVKDCMEVALWPLPTSQFLPGLHPTQGSVNMNVVSDEFGYYLTAYMI